MTGTKRSLKHTLAIVGVLAVVFSTKQALACSFCPPDLTESLLKRVDSADAAVFAKLVRLPDPNDKHPASRYRVAVVLKGDANKGETIEVPLDVKSPIGSVHLFLSDATTEGWRNPRGVSREARSFLELASKLPAGGGESSVDDRAKRLAFMLPYLITQDVQIANSVYGEFAAAPDSAVKQLKPDLNHQRLKAWIALEPVSPKHRRLMFTLLAVCQDAEDLPFIKAALNDWLQRDELFELDAIIATYLTLAGGKGLDEIDRRLLRPTDVSLEARHGARAAFSRRQRHRYVKEETHRELPTATEGSRNGRLRARRSHTLGGLGITRRRTQVAANRRVEQPLAKAADSGLLKRLPVARRESRPRTDEPTQRPVNVSGPMNHWLWNA